MGAGGGTAVIEALWHGAREVTFVEQNPILLAQTRRWPARFHEDRFPGQEVNSRLSDARRFVLDEGEEFALITMDGPAAPGASAAGAKGFRGDFLMTRGDSTICSNTSTRNGGLSPSPSGPICPLGTRSS